MPVESAIKDHQAWLGYLQPDGLVVSAAALVDAQVLLAHNILPLQERFRPFTTELEVGAIAVTDFNRFVREFLGWPDKFLYGLADDRPTPESLTVPLENYGDVLDPSFAFLDPKPRDPENPWLLLVQTLPVGTALDDDYTPAGSNWTTSPARRFLRLLRETKVGIGLLSNGTHFRLIYAPQGE